MCMVSNHGLFSRLGPQACALASPYALSDQEIRLVGKLTNDPDYGALSALANAQAVRLVRCSLPAIFRHPAGGNVLDLVDGSK